MFKPWSWGRALESAERQSLNLYLQEPGKPLIDLLTGRLGCVAWAQFPRGERELKDLAGLTGAIPVA
jgi:hypothetical protein